MSISIAERLRPFSHLPGTSCLLPGTPFRFTLYPALIRVESLEFSTPKLIEEIELPIQAPVKDFTVQLDLEKQRIRVWADTKNGFMRYSIYKNGSHYTFAAEKNPQAALPFAENKPALLVPQLERLSLGNHKAQDWELVKRRADLAEIMPIWFHLGQTYNQQYAPAHEGTAAFLTECRRQIMTGNPNTFLEPFQALSETGFSGILSPRLHDLGHRGYTLPPITEDTSPLILLKQGAELIRSLFFSFNKGEADLLPALPTAFHCGRMLNLTCGDLGTLDMEWSSKRLRRFYFHATKDGTIRFNSPKELQTMRLNDRRISTHQKMELVGGQTYVFDRFEQ